MAQILIKTVVVVAAAFLSVGAAAQNAPVAPPIDPNGAMACPMPDEGMGGPVMDEGMNGPGGLADMQQMPDQMQAMHDEMRAMDGELVAMHAQMQAMQQEMMRLRAAAPWPN